MSLRLASAARVSLWFSSACQRLAYKKLGDRFRLNIHCPACLTAAMDESNATCGKRLESIGLENTVENRQAYRELLVTTPGLGEYISGENLAAGCLPLCGSEFGTGRRFLQLMPGACACHVCADVSCLRAPCPSPLIGAILFEETLYQDTRKGTSMVDELNKNVSSQGSHSSRAAASKHRSHELAADHTSNSS